MVTGAGVAGPRAGECIAHRVQLPPSCARPSTAGPLPPGPASAQRTTGSKAVSASPPAYGIYGGVPPAPLIAAVPPHLPTALAPARRRRPGCRCRCRCHCWSWSWRAAGSALAPAAAGAPQCAVIHCRADPRTQTCHRRRYRYRRHRHAFHHRRCRRLTARVLPSQARHAPPPASPLQRLRPRDRRAPSMPVCPSLTTRLAALALRLRQARHPHPAAQRQTPARETHRHRHRHQRRPFHRCRRLSSASSPRPLHRRRRRRRRRTKSKSSHIRRSFPNTAAGTARNQARPAPPALLLLLLLCCRWHLRRGGCCHH